jgi:IS5 family transposase
MGTLQRGLFPKLEECWQTPLTEKEQQLVKILELIRIEKFVPRRACDQHMGRKVREREAIARSFVAKAVYGFPHTRRLLEALKTTPSLRRICGFERVSSVPSESTFSRAFADFAKSKLGERVHNAMVEDKLKPELERQLEQTAEESLDELPAWCDVGTKKNSKGYKETWIGYKLHADVNDCGLPISVALTAASLHDSQIAIPLMKMSSAKVDYLYDVMDAAYDAGPIYEVSRSLGHVPIIDKNARGKEVVPMAPHEAVRYNERTVVERFNSRIKEEFGGDNVMVRGASKVMMHLMFGVLALFADHLIKLAT